ncbi:Hypothetical protein CINCED_3A022999 [Cinara cedri]|nr:Hypothetical protein CINCED_3A022999 [Cinara cedri]
MVSAKRIVEEGKPPFEDQLKAVSKHYMKLVENRPNIVIGTSYAHLKECLLKIEKSGYLNSIIKPSHKEVNTSEEINTSDEIPQNIKQIDSLIEPIRDLDNISISSVNNVEYNSKKIETVYFTNNNVSGNTVDNEPCQNKNIVDTVFNSSFEFLQDSQLDDDVYSVNPNSIPTQTFSSSHYKSQSTDQETKLNHLKNIVNVSKSWAEKVGVNSQNKTETGVSNLPKENWSQTVIDSTNNDWLVKNNWVHMVEADNSEQKILSNAPHTNSSNSLVTNGYSENLKGLLKKSVVFNKQDPYPMATSNNPTFYQSNYRQPTQQNNIGNYTNSNSTYYDKNQSTDLNKRSATAKSKTTYASEYWRN